MRGHISGFTLIEMLVALALVSLMSLGMYQAFSLSHRSLMQVTLADTGGRDVASAQRFLRRVIEGTYPFEPTPGVANDPTRQGLSGTNQALELSAPALAAEGSKGLYRFHVALESDSSGDLIVGWAHDRNGMVSPATGRHDAREVILAGVRSLSISYLELIARGDGKIEASWQESWVGRLSPPALVRVRLEFAPGDKRQWPEFVASPRISTDANCIFDVVSQVCRTRT